MTYLTAAVALATLLAVTYAAVAVIRSLAHIESGIRLLRWEVKQLIATNEVVDKLCDAVLAAQAAQAGAEDAMAQAQADLAALTAEVELTPETQAKVELILGNAVAAPPVTP